MNPTPLRFDVPPFVLTGRVYAAVLNHVAQIRALGDAVNRPPYKAPPRAPALSIKPRNTQARDGDAVEVPAFAPAQEIGATLGVVIGRTACRVPVGAALDWVAGYTIVNDLSVPLASHYRPAVRLKARDGFCPIGPRVVPAARIPRPDALAVTVRVDDAVVWHGDTGQRVRGVAQLLADVTEFMTLQPGDLLLLGAASPAPQAGPGQRVAIDIEELGTLNHTLIAAVP